MAGAGYKLFATGDVLTAAQVNTYLQEQTVMVFADATARTTALSGVLSEGMVTYLKDTNVVEVYDGSAWIGTTGDITGVTATSPLTGGGTTGAITVGIQDGTTSQKGAVQLEDSTSSTSTTKAATPNSVKSAYDLANGAIAKTLVDAKGDLIVASAADAVARLAVGADGTVLVADSSATNGIKWGTVSSSSGLTLIASSTFTTSSQVNVTSCFSSTYDNYRVVLTLSASGGAADGFGIQFRSGTTNSTSDYSCFGLSPNSSADTIYTFRQTSSASGGIGYQNNGSGQFIIDIRAPYLSQKTSWHSNFSMNGGTYATIAGYYAGNHALANSYDGFSIIPATSTITGAIRVYGYQNS